MADVKGRVARHVHLIGATAGTAQIRTADFQGRSHVVVPVVALVEGVIFAQNAQTPELVLAEDMAIAPQGWNGRPVVGDHPADNGTQVSASTPGTLETCAFGTVFNARMDGKRLCMEAWLDPLRAAAVGPAALRVLERVQANEMVEVSVGVYVVAEPGAGKYQGQAYSGKWTAIMPDHLALLPDGTPGACSIEAGCGAPRRAAVHAITPAGLVLVTPALPKGAQMKRKLGEILAGLWRAAQASSREAAVTDQDLRSELERLLRATVPGYLGIDNVLLDESSVVYACAPETDVYLHQQGYTLAADGTVALTGTAIEVELVTQYEPVGGDPASTERYTARAAGAHPCSCGGSPAPVTTPKQAAAGEITMKDTTKTLIAESAGKYTDADAVWLDAVPAEKLALLKPAAPDPAAITAAAQKIVADQRAADDRTTAEKAAEKAAAEQKAADEKAAADKAAAEQKAADEKAAAERALAAKPKSEAEWLKDAPPSVRALVDRAAAAEAIQKAELLAKLKAANVTEYSEAELTAMPVPELSRVARLAKVDVVAADYSGLAVPRVDAAARQAAEAIPPAPSLYDRVRGAAAAK